MARNNILQIEVDNTLAKVLEFSTRPADIEAELALSLLVKSPRDFHEVVDAFVGFNPPDKKYPKWRLKSNVWERNGLKLRPRIGRKVAQYFNVVQITT
jgi:hypothetical protein